MPADGGPPVALTTLEMLEALEAGFVTLTRNREKKPEAVGNAEFTPEVLRARIEKAGLTREEFTSLFDIPFDVWQGWVHGKIAIPAWVQPALQMLVLLSPTAKRKLLQSPKAAAQNSKRKAHPFSRLEDL